MRIIPLGGLLLVGVLVTGCSSMTDGISLTGGEGGTAKLQQQSSNLGQRVSLELKQLRRQDERLELAIKVKVISPTISRCSTKLTGLMKGGCLLNPGTLIGSP